MRGRSKSMCASSSKLFEPESNASEDDEYQAEAETALSVEYNMNIIRKVWEQLPKIDNMPYDRRLEQIDWNRVADDTCTPRKAKQQFENIIAAERKYRILNEILKDLEKRILSEVNLPKKPLPAFSIFEEENKNLIKTKIGQNIRPGSFSKVASEVFKHLSEEEKKRYRQKSNQMKKEYKDVVAKFNLEDKFTKKAIVPKTRIDNPATYYHNQLKSQGSNIKFQEARKLFNNLSKKEKLSLIFKFLGVKKGEKVLNLEQYKKAKEVLSKDDMAMIDDYEGKPKTMSAYNAFMKDFLASNKVSAGLQWSELFKAGVQQWKQLPAEKKYDYENASAKRKIKFKEDYDEYIASLPQDRQEYETTKNKGKHKKVKEDSLRSEVNNSLNYSDAAPKKRKSKKSTTDTENVKSQQTVSLDKLKKKERKEKSLNSKDELDAYVSEDVLQKKKKLKLSKKFAEDEHLSKETSLAKLESKSNSSTQEEEKKKKIKMSKNSAEYDHNLSNEISPVKVESKSNSSKQEKEKNKKIKVSKNFIRDEQNLSNETWEEQTEARNSKFIEEIKEEPQNKKKRKISSISEDNQNRSNKSSQENEKSKNSFIEDINQDQEKFSKKGKEFPRKPPSSLRKFYASKLFKGPSSQANMYFNSLSQKEIKALTAKYDRAKKTYVQEFENFLKSLSKKELLHFQKHGFPSVQDSSEDSDSSNSSEDSDSSESTH